LPSDRPALCGCGGAAVATTQGCSASGAGGKILHNTILTNGTHPNAIEYRFANTKGLVIANNLTDAKILSRNDAEAEEYGHFTQAVPAMFADPAGCDLHLKSPVAGVVGAAEKLRPPLTAADRADSNGRTRRSDGPGDIGAAEYRRLPDGTN